MNSIVSWYSTSWQEIKRYYDIYSTKCNLLQVNELSPNEFFVIMDVHALCNFLRLFNEIPVLCASKIQRDRRNFTGAATTNIDSNLV